MNTDTSQRRCRRRFEAIAFDWDGTAVTDRHADATPVREQIEALVRLGVDVGVISGTHVENIDSQLHARPTGPGRLHLCVNRDAVADAALGAVAYPPGTRTLVAVGSRQHGGIQRLLEGSVSLKLVRAAAALLVVPADNPESGPQRGSFTGAD